MKIKENKKFQKDILSILRDSSIKIVVGDLEKILIDDFGYQKEYDNHIDILSSKIHRTLDILEKEELILKEYGSSGYGHRGIYSTITNKGYKIFDPWYKKIFKFFTDELSKVFSLIALILSIIATFLSIVSYFK